MEKEAEKPAVGNIVGNILLIAVATLLPGIDWALFGWIHFFLPLLIFFFMVKYGLQVGLKYILTGCVIALIGGLVTQTLPSLLVSYSLVPAGYFLARSAFANNSPVFSAFKGGTALIACWLLLSLGTQLVTGSSPYAESVQTFDLWIDETVQYYNENPLQDPNAQQLIESSLPQMKGLLHLILPGLLLSSSVFVIVLTMVLGNRMVAKYCETDIWPLFRLWKLPDKLIWVLIGSAGMAFLPSEITRPIGINLIILLSTVYSFQGFAICVFFMNKWNVPIIFRSFLYVMLIFQQVGSILLLIVGIFDTWIDFRKLTTSDADTAKP